VTERLVAHDTRPRLLRNLAPLRSDPRLFRQNLEAGRHREDELTLKQRENAVKATRREMMTGAAMFAAAGTRAARSEAIAPSPQWTNAMPSAPMPATKITAEYAALVGRNAFFWAWPMVNVYSRRLVYEKVPEIMLSGPIPVAPVNHLGMLSDYIVPEERIVACPNQDVVYGVGGLAFDQSAVVIQVPISATDFGSIRLSICVPTALPISARCMA
jgi:hypothetical protein